MSTCKFCGRPCEKEFCSSYHKGRYTLIHKFDKPPEPEDWSRIKRHSTMSGTLNRMRHGGQ